MCGGGDQLVLFKGRFSTNLLGGSGGQDHTQRRGDGASVKTATSQRGRPASQPLLPRALLISHDNDAKKTVNLLVQYYLFKLG